MGHAAGDRTPPCIACAGDRIAAVGTVSRN